ncbi:MAG: NAD-dependent epimerase/dehydratase family protein, partial [Propionibacteriaceae bacterium]|nr:NAD-dependent epimerase/dehydratase family protein [Propionibacteriaceae bacterium]
MRVLLAGGSGMIGSALRAWLGSEGHEVRMLLRSDAAPNGYSWLGRPGSVPEAAVDWADAIVSLNGASLSHLPWTKSYRESIRCSRVDATQGLAQAIAESADPPLVWVSGSAVGYYGDATGEAELVESSPAGTSFLAQVVNEWERATEPAELRTRVVNIRTGLVMARSGALAPLALATRFGAGARIGRGSQWWPWISLEDEVRAIAFALEEASLRG